MESSLYPFFKGRVALSALLSGLDIGAGDEVVLQGYTCVVVPNAVKYLGAKPVYADIDPDTFNLEPESLQQAITARTRAIIIQHTYGLPAPVDRLLKIAAERGIPVIEDACHAFGTRYQGRELGTFGVGAFFSSQWSKPITTGLGGWAVVNDPALRQKVEAFTQRWPAPSLKIQLLILLQYLAHRALFKPWLYFRLRQLYRWLSSARLTVGSSTAQELSSLMPADYLQTMGPVQRRILSGKLSTSNRTRAHRQILTHMIQGFLKADFGQALRVEAEVGDLSMLCVPVRVKDKEQLLARAVAARLEVWDWFLSPVHPCLSGWEAVDYRSGSCPEAERACREVVALPTHHGIGEREVQRYRAFLLENKDLVLRGEGTQVPL